MPANSQFAGFSAVLCVSDGCAIWDWGKSQLRPVQSIPTRFAVPNHVDLHAFQEFEDDFERVRPVCAAGTGGVRAMCALGTDEFGPGAAPLRPSSNRVRDGCGPGSSGLALGAAPLRPSSSRVRDGCTRCADRSRVRSRIVIAALGDSHLAAGEGGFSTAAAERKGTVPDVISASKAARGTTRRFPSFTLSSRPTRSQCRTVDLDTRASSATSSTRRKRTSLEPSIASPE